MLLQTIELPIGGTVTAYLHEESIQAPYEICKRRPAMILCPGGGYEHIAFREKDAPAMAFLNMGFQVFALEYSLRENAKCKKPLEQLARTILLVRENSARLHVDQCRVFVMGFSAGGNLAASLGVHWCDPDLLNRCGIQDGKQLRPDGLILAYPVISMGEYTHSGTCRTITADTADQLEYWSLETQVDSQTPPTFIWHTVNDPIVPVQNTLLFVNALINAGVSCECHLFPNGPHGMSVCTGEVGTKSIEVGMWITLCRNWINANFGQLGGC